MTSGDPNEGHVKTVALSLGERESHEMVLTGESRAETQGHRVPAAAMSGPATSPVMAGDTGSEKAR